jgi:hypothetical protein
MRAASITGDRRTAASLTLASRLRERKTQLRHFGKLETWTLV